MLIQCPRCQARSKLPSSQEGAKVRCGECGRVFVAHPPGRSRGQGGLSPGAIVGLGAGLAALVVFALVRTFGGEKPTPVTQAAGPDVPVDEAPEDEVGWNSPVVRTAVRLHEATFAYDTSTVQSLLHGPRLWAVEQAELHAESGAAGPPPTPAEFHLLPQLEQLKNYDRWIEDLTAGEGRALVGDWRPYDGEALELTDDEALVRLAVTPRNAEDSAEKRWVEWHLARDGVRWKAWSWERWISPEDMAAERRARAREIERVELSDGSVVYEREPQPLEHLPGSPPELRERIDRLYATLLDLDLTREAVDAQHELVEIGRPAIPVLLTGLYETPLDTEENAIRCNLIVQTLRRITGEFMGYKPQVAVGSGTGTTEERRESAIRQWFAWWWRYDDKFTEKETTDGLEGLIELTDREKRWLERNKD